MKIKQAVTLLCCLALGSGYSANLSANERWFEVEVILLSQLSDKSSLKEEFSDKTALPRVRKPVDLIKQHLHNGIAELKQKLPFCQQTNQLVPFYSQAKQPTLFELKTLNELEQTAAFANVTQVKVRDELDPLSSHESETATTQQDDFFDRVLTEKEKMLNEDAESLAQPINAVNTVSEEPIAPLTQDQLALLSQAEQYFHAKKFPFSDIETHQHLLCRITAAEFEQLEVDENHYSYLGYTINTVPEKISAYEYLFSNSPYLLNEYSFELNDIVTQLKRSKNFKPLLHIGWRQPVSSRRKAIPITLYAGDNLTADYLQKLENYQTQVAFKHTADESNNLNSLEGIGGINSSNTLSSEQPKTEQQIKLDLLFSQLSTPINTQSQLIAALSSLDSINSVMGNNQAMMPLSPPQPWYLDGLMRIYINDNNRLNIIADFNIANVTLAEQATKALALGNPEEIKSIPFRQHRQVISTEIHYFDHPYMGMIVQIRRHKRPEPSSEIDLADINNQ
ncbi:CsiV family protein [Thalassotalea ganghwensis]